VWHESIYIPTYSINLDSQQFWGIFFLPETHSHLLMFRLFIGQGIICSELNAQFLGFLQLFGVLLTNLAQILCPFTYHVLNTQSQNQF
jgi:hypothetical protein